MSLTVEIESAEHTFRQVLEDFFISVYDEKKLPSHGLDHHRRVWEFARELLLSDAGRNIVSCNPSELIIACYLHDIGMSADPGPRHGKLSSEYCTVFLNKHRLPSSHYPELTGAILSHDRKEYTDEGPVTGLLRVLAAADDLDAFGYTGVYRYAEIYLTRGIEPAILGHKVRENAAARFGNFCRIFSADPVLTGKHEKRYRVLDDFYREYNDQVLNYDFGIDKPEGPCGVISAISEMIRKHSGLHSLLSQSAYNDKTSFISSFLGKLELELRL